MMPQWELNSLFFFQVDPTGERTIGVLTKVDIMDRGTDCRDVLLGKTLKLRHGWVSVVNRGQADLNSRVGHHSL